ncbi:MAG: helix-turn-helix domain-containing protein [Chloroflexi bacterium]|nr:helix-turn-helix domain-containing protein [Chloroflexota bacterium]MYA50418.1 helix-turn-helix domain-containing protein [Chloroflexota bacterium]MYB83883.1 helix-turn-helix domain-containing protein [Chloroflexota bacterium]MYK35108.1 helix-turn-helix domain-containing protein [Chloroflexota bacterium]
MPTNGPLGNTPHDVFLAMTAEIDEQRLRAAQAGFAMRAYRESFLTEDGQRGLSQEGLLRLMASIDDEYAERFSHATVSRWESGATRPTVRRLQVFGMALGLSPTEVAGLILLAGLAPDLQTASSMATNGGSSRGPESEPTPGEEYGPTDPVAGGGHATATAPPLLGGWARFVFLRCLPLGVAIVGAGYVLSFLDWENIWTPAFYVGLATALVVTQGFLFPDRTIHNREFFWVTLFVVLSTPLLQFAPLGMDHYSLYRVGDSVGTYVPFLLALLVNLALAASAGLMFQFLWQWQRSRYGGEGSILQRSVWTVLPPVGFVYAVVLVISNASVWIQLGVLMPATAVLFIALLVVQDPSTNPSERDRQFLLSTTLAAAIVSSVLGLLTIIAVYVSPDLPMVLPDHNMLNSWEIDFAALGFSREEALDRLNLGYPWHAITVFGYMAFVVAGNLVASMYRLGGRNNDTPEARAPGER